MQYNMCNKNLRLFSSAVLVIKSFVILSVLPQALAGFKRGASQQMEWKGEGKGEGMKGREDTPKINLWL